jgi:hypothetical protein
MNVLNSVICANYRNGEARIDQQHLVELLVSREVEASSINNSQLLDVVTVYREIGWQVEYHAPSSEMGHTGYYVFRG